MILSYVINEIPIAVLNIRVLCNLRFQTLGLFSEFFVVPRSDICGGIITLWKEKPEPRCHRLTVSEFIYMMWLYDIARKTENNDTFRVAYLLGDFSWFCSPTISSVTYRTLWKHTIFYVIFLKFLLILIGTINYQNCIKYNAGF